MGGVTPNLSYAFLIYIYLYAGAESFIPIYIHLCMDCTLSSMEYEQALAAEQTVDQPQQPHMTCHEVGTQTGDQPTPCDLRPLEPRLSQRVNRPVVFVAPNSHIECHCEFCVPMSTRVEGENTLIGTWLNTRLVYEDTSILNHPGRSPLRASLPLIEEDDEIHPVAGGPSREPPRRRHRHRSRPYSGLLRGVIYQSATDTD